MKMLISGWLMSFVLISFGGWFDIWSCKWETFKLKLSFLWYGNFYENKPCSRKLKCLLYNSAVC
jgi:hypothetical protein